MAQNAYNNIEWWEDLTHPVDYEKAVKSMELRVAAIRNDSGPGLVRLLQHPPIYTAGTSSNKSDLLDAHRFPVIQTGRGGQYTYHGPGQLVGYVMLDLAQRGNDVRRFVHDLETWLIETLAHFGVAGVRKDGRVGIWVDLDSHHKRRIREFKIAAIGVRVRRWVSYHGISLNVAPELNHFLGIIPCGINDYGVTSLADLGISVNIEEVATVMRGTFEKAFGYSTVSHNNF